MAVSLRVLQVRARRVGERLNVRNFKASRGWVENFIRRNGVQASVKFHGKENAKLPKDYYNRIAEIKEIASTHDLKNIYNQDESGLFYRLCQNWSYLTSQEYRAGARGTFLQKAKQRLSVSFAVNCDGSHALPLRYIGKSERPNFFKTHKWAKSFYSAQKSAWMDGAQFKKWLNWWYSEVSKLSNGPWLLIVDNCGGHESRLSFLNLRIEFLPSNATGVPTTF